MPVFNEGATLEEIVARVMRASLPPKWQIKLTMIDDGSRPAAAALTAACAAGYGSSVELIVHTHNQGKGAAVMTGFDSVLQQSQECDAVLIQDADLEYDPADYQSLLRALEDPKVGAVFGNRWSASTPNSGYRHAHARANQVLTWISNQATGLAVHDMECCYKLLRVPVLRTVRPWLSERRFGIEPQMAAAFARHGICVSEVEVSYAPRTFAEGKKIRWTDGVRALWVIARERFRRTPPSGARQ